MSLSPGFLLELEAIAPVKLDEPSGAIPLSALAARGRLRRGSFRRQVADIIGLCRRAKVPFFVLGSGSNIVIGDRGIRGVTIGNAAQALSQPAPQPGDGVSYVVQADAGCSFAALARRFAFAGYAGLEWACGIPGTLGGAVVYNAGAYGGCLADVLRRVVVTGEDGDLELQAADLNLVYRASDFTRGLMAGKAVLSAEFTLWRGDALELRRSVREYDSRRLAAQPRGRNAGSFFKNPPDQPAWKLLDAVGLRAYRVGGAQLSESTATSYQRRRRDGGGRVRPQTTGAGPCASASASISTTRSPWSGRASVCLTACAWARLRRPFDRARVSVVSAQHAIAAADPERFDVAHRRQQVRRLVRRRRRGRSTALMPPSRRPFGEGRGIAARARAEVLATVDAVPADPRHARRGRHRAGPARWPACPTSAVGRRQRHRHGQGPDEGRFGRRPAGVQHTIVDLRDWDDDRGRRAPESQVAYPAFVKPQTAARRGVSRVQPRSC
jgi:UDP-N-acetylmuramate dehydrogenase